MATATATVSVNVSDADELARLLKAVDSVLDHLGHYGEIGHTHPVAVELREAASELAFVRDED